MSGLPSFYSGLESDSDSASSSDDEVVIVHRTGTVQPLSTTVPAQTVQPLSTTVPAPTVQPLSTTLPSPDSDLEEMSFPPRRTDPWDLDFESWLAAESDDDDAPPPPSPAAAAAASSSSSSSQLRDRERDRSEGDGTLKLNVLLPDARPRTEHGFRTLILHYVPPGTIVRQYRGRLGAKVEEFYVNIGRDSYQKAWTFKEALSLSNKVRRLQRIL